MVDGVHPRSVSSSALRKFARGGREGTGPVSGDRSLVLCHQTAKEMTREAYERILSSSKNNT